MIVDSGYEDRGYTEATALDRALHALYLDPEVRLKNGDIVLILTPSEARALLQELDRR